MFHKTRDKIDLKEKTERLPRQPGVYIMYDGEGTIIYIGKAKVLANRVKQYFSNTAKPVKVQNMVDRIADFEYVITNTELDALALEANLIKKHRPQYNILLKDDKASPYIKIDFKKDFPAVEITRRVKADGAKYFGPYFGGIYVNDVAEILTSAYRVRRCALKIAENGKPKRPCLNYHIELCSGPCGGLVTREEYLKRVADAVGFLSGKHADAEKLLTEKMERAAAAEEFERAINYRDRLKTLEKMKEKTVADLGNAADIDAFGFATDGEYGAVSALTVRMGKMMGARNFPVTDASLSERELMESFLAQYYSQNRETPDEIYLPCKIDGDDALAGWLKLRAGKRKLNIFYPKAGVKKKLLDTAGANAADFLTKSVNKIKLDENMTAGAVAQLKKLLGLRRAPNRIECYDISNTSGLDKVASQVVFIGGVKASAEYRRFKIKTVEGADDFACMKEVLTRRLARADGGDKKFDALPDLIVVDGGKGQLSSAYGALCEAGRADIDMIGLAKREEDVFKVGEAEPSPLPKMSYALKLLIRVRDEAHRFAITYHRKLRDKKFIGGKK